MRSTCSALALTIDADETFSSHHKKRFYVVDETQELGIRYGTLISTMQHPCFNLKN